MTLTIVGRIDVLAWKNHAGLDHLLKVSVVPEMFYGDVG